MTFTDDPRFQDIFDSLLLYFAQNNISWQAFFGLEVEPFTALVEDRLKSLDLAWETQPSGDWTLRHTKEARVYDVAAAREHLTQAMQIMEQATTPHAWSSLSYNAEIPEIRATFDCLRQPLAAFVDLDSPRGSDFAGARHCATMAIVNVLERRYIIDRMLRVISIQMPTKEEPVLVMSIQTIRPNSELEGQAVQNHCRWGANR